MHKVKKLQKENNLLEKGIHATHQEAYTNMIICLRGAEINPYHQELIRNDLVTLLLDGQERQATLDDVFGEDKHLFMDQVMAVTPHMTKKEKQLNNLRLGVMIMVIFMLIYFGRDLLNYILGQFIIHKEVIVAVQLTVIDFVMAVLIAFLATKLVSLIINSTYTDNKKTQKKSIIFYGIFAYILIAFTPLLGIVMQLPKITIPFWIYILLTAFVYACYKAMEKYLNEKYNKGF
ncbi:hypothetical protein QYR54_10105 [Streptococcus iniae]|nr:hypothetical protein QYR54_10105 [Streptococcus iniae]